MVTSRFGFLNAYLQLFFWHLVDAGLLGVKSCTGGCRELRRTGTGSGHPRELQSRGLASEKRRRNESEQKSELKAVGLERMDPCGPLQTKQVLDFFHACLPLAQPERR